MAKVTKNVVEVPDPPYTVTIELSQEEAEKLKWVLGQMTAGNDATSSLWRELHESNVKSTKPNDNPFMSLGVKDF